MDEFGSTSEVEAHTDVDAGVDASIDAASVVGLDELEAARDEGPSTDRELRRKRLAAMMFGEDTGPSHFGRYLLLEHLGEGGVGTVQLAYDAELDRRVALKLLRAHHNVSEAARLRMRREAQALARLSHPNVVPVYETGEIDGQVYIVMEFVVGQTLRAWARGGEGGQARRSWSEILEVYLQAARGLAAAHATGVVHRDFKPDNAILGEDGRVRVLDFGLARDARSSAEETAPPETGDAEQTGGSLDPDASGRAALGLEEDADEDADEGALEHAVTRPDANPSARSGSQPAGEGWVFERTSTGERPSSFDEDLTATGAVLGTPAYMAPEQYLRAKVGPTADQYSFCAALFEALYDRRPFAGKTLSPPASSAGSRPSTAPPSSSPSSSPRPRRRRA
ncbi:serine/threonine kinase family protein [Plesiocystis pacifica SIR-1]|uniref:Serine/threonine kinase family protein n=1 Tax=Plesiocystis pacifica SIR-1 TaxID=391625 RepID=A6G3V3_9BACT|nr:serine/threonine-protein kinase [Plesiocystis pacifica]EDM79490.1 serine/threonine kinase family protein [Plesiocystis pacifica SIR-1]